MAVRIVITGGPGSGKSVCFERLKFDPALADFVFFDELARRLLAEDPSFRTRRTAFHREIYRRQVERENRAVGQSFISDRGTVDAFAFHPETVADVGTSLEREYARYDGVLHLGSSAALGNRFYRQDDIRLESLDDALFIAARIEAVWRDHPCYRFVEAMEDFEAKYTRFRFLLDELVGGPKEREQKIS